MTAIAIDHATAGWLAVLALAGVGLLVGAVALADRWHRRN